MSHNYNSCHYDNSDNNNNIFVIIIKIIIIIVVYKKMLESNWFLTALNLLLNLANAATDQSNLTCSMISRSCL